jgi:hypothetical protein
MAPEAFSRLCESNNTMFRTKFDSSNCKSIEELTLPSPCHFVIVVTDLPTSLIIYVHDQHDSQITSTGRCALLRSCLKKSLSSARQDFGGIIVILLLEISSSDNTELLMSFVICARSNSKVEEPLALLFTKQNKK